MKTVAFFGHRKIFNREEVKKRIMEKLLEITPIGYVNFLVGEHGEFDRIALSTVLEYKKRFNSGIKIYVVLTNMCSLNKTKRCCSAVEDYISRGCETYFYDIEKEYFKNRIIVSNRKMVDDSDLIISYIDSSKYNSGAKLAVNYAIKNKKEVINLFNISDRNIQIYN